MMKYEKYIRLLPVLMYVGNMAAFVMIKLHVNIVFIKDFIYYLNQMTGHSILICVFGLFYAIRHKHCIFLQTLWVGCGLLNMLNISKKILNFGYYSTYAIILLSIALILGLFWQIKRMK